ncbi:DUF3616 domain-containing protein [Massilia sp. HP4]|uniref:DUF3616 domain-containing protein n=1 Tax=Massilia sp. HP4 TaxID=2562316 RepID=UPI0010BFE303|nr:DUF3616 domain-containing protein [Massilia sp. HP4]
MHPSNIVLLEFHPERDALSPGKQLRNGLSVALRMGDTLWLANDESLSIERLTLAAEDSRGKTSFARAHRQYALHDFLALPLPPYEAEGKRINEADIEGLASDGGYLWLTGSHSLRRKRPDEGDGVRRSHKRLANVSADGNRYLLARIPLVGRDGSHELVKETGSKGKRRTAALLRGDEHGNELTALLRNDEHFGPFLAIPGKDNGFDIEGIALAGKHVLLGLRGPVLRGWAAIVEVAPVDDAGEGWLRLAPLDEDGAMYRKHFLDLDGLGIRDLCVQGKDLLILAGPTMDLDGPVTLFRWPGGARPDKASAVTREMLEHVLALPFGQGVDHPEGISLFSSQDGREEELLVVHDSASPSRQIGDSTLVADVYALPPRRNKK